MKLGLAGRNRPLEQWRTSSECWLGPLKYNPASQRKAVSSEAALLRLRPPSDLCADPEKKTRCSAPEVRGHVTPKGLLQSYLAVTLREREWNERPTARGRANTGVYVFTCGNACGMSELRAKRHVRGSCGSNARLLRRQRDESKGSVPGVLCAPAPVKALRCAPTAGAALRGPDCRLRCG